MLDMYGRTIDKAYDYVVIGSGSAGAVVAARLADDDAVRVLLVEAGPKDTSIFIRMPAALGFPLMSDKYNWYLHSEPEPGLNGRRIYEACGRVLGGSSSINGMNWVRGAAWDYDNWAAIGNKGWSYPEVLPYFKKAETFRGRASAFRGENGPMTIEVCEARNPLYRAFLEAGEQFGLPLVEDHNSDRQEGVHVTQRNVRGGIRCSTSLAYLHSAPSKANLHIWTSAIVQRIEFSDRRAVAVVIQANHEAIPIGIDREVIVSGGAIHSPQILMLSGIGDADELTRLSIPVVAHLPGVGRGLKDHLAAPVQYQATQQVSAATEFSLVGRLKIGALWYFFKRGIGATNFFEVGAFIRSDHTVTVPNVQFEFVPMLGELQHGGVKLENGFQYFFSLMRPTSTGRVWLDSADPAKAPRFQFNFLTTPEDQHDAIAAVRATREIIAQPAWAPYRGREVTPGEQVQSDAELLAFLRDTAGTNYHPCCTCRMGSDVNAVVDTVGRVCGLENIRVIDASIMPQIVSGNLNAPVIMMAEKLADAVRGRPAPPAAIVPYHRVSR
jgi:choline dehydrogenase